MNVSGGWEPVGREEQLILLAAEGLTDREIAERLGLSQQTVGTYWQRLMKRLGASTRTQVVAMAMAAAAGRSRQTLVELRGKVDLLKSTMDLLDTGILVEDAEGEILLVNKALTEMFRVYRWPNFDKRLNVAQVLQSSGGFFSEGAHAVERLMEISSRGVDVNSSAFETNDGRVIEVDYQILENQKLWRFRDVTNAAVKAQAMDVLLQQACEVFCALDDRGKVLLFRDSSRPSEALDVYAGSEVENAFPAFQDTPHHQKMMEALESKAPLDFEAPFGPWGSAVRLRALPLVHGGIVALLQIIPC
jgi:DNA-binding CsgD family transcriptional regulator